jgi:hypothetical protein
VSEEKKRGRGNPRKPFIGPRLPASGNLPNPKAPECRVKWRDSKGIWHVCHKRGRHLKHGK